MQSSIQLFLFISSLSLLSLVGQAQKDTRPTEKAILLEKAFIEASREKILGNYDEAVRLYLDVLQKDHENAVANYELARVYQKLKQSDKALLRAERAVGLDQYNLYYNELYASLLEKEGNYKKAAELYGSLAEHYTSKDILYHEWAYYLTKAERPDQAIKVYNTLEKRKGVKEAISMRKYKLYLGIGKDKKAIAELDKLIKAYPNNAEYVVRLANYYATQKKQDLAQELYKKAIKLDPNNATANMALVEVFAQNGDTTQYLKALKTVFADNQQNVKTKIQILEPLLGKLTKGGLKKHQTSITALAQQLTETHPSTFTTNAYYAHLLFYQEKYNIAERYYQTALSIDKSDIKAWTGLLEAQHRQQGYKRLVVASKDVIELFPSQPIGFYYQGISQHYVGAQEEAKKALEEAAEISVADLTMQGYAYQYLGLVYTALDKDEEAEKAFESALELLPNSAEVLNAYSYSLAERNDQLGKATQLAKEITDREPQNPEFRATYGWVFYKQAKYDDALKQFEQALDLGGTNSPIVLEHYGDTLFQLNKKEKAVEYWQKALDNGSSSSILQRKITTKQLYE
ncbi:MAG: tetratricopeptide repeat protein [Aureispira sp.]|nr:tetratricopeptide repeat protein [Aureispira sp.]